LFSEEEKEKIIEHGCEFRKHRNECSSTEIRNLMLNSPIVRIGKVLYTSSPTMEELFWNQIYKRKKAEIIDLTKFKELHINDINKIPTINFVGDL